VGAGTSGGEVEIRRIRRIRRTVNAPHTSWRFMNSYETSLVKCGEDGTSRSPSIRMSNEGYLPVSPESPRYSYSYLDDKSTHCPSHKNQPQPRSSHALAAFSARTIARHAFRLQSCAGRSGHWLDKACWRSRVST
jgi:hypothetical protein